ncbi:MAG TPA: RNA 2',3'-cyclic phosphodiesterase [Acidimicrobiales bacterium]|nr:RNA 2',3'-cyclic phosphodiesterase [Acidimicrobiales bacterium]
MRLFVAVWPPAGAAAAITAALAGAPAPDRRLRWVPAERWHVTLRFFGEADPDEAAGALAAVGAPAAEATLGPATGRFGRRVLHVPVAGLEGLASAVVAATAGVGRPPEERPFAGHLTLARARDRRGVDLSPWCGLAVAASWPVGEVTLVASRGGAYEVVGRRPLPG